MGVGAVPLDIADLATGSDIDQLATEFNITTLSTEFNTTVLADADILASDITITLDGILRVTVAVDTAVVFKLKLTRDATTKVLEYNAGATLAADALCIFDLSVRADDQVNFRAGDACVVHMINVDYIVAMGP